MSNIFKHPKPERRQIMRSIFRGPQSDKTIETTRKDKTISTVVNAEPDDHVFIVIYRKDRPAVSIDLFAGHGRGGMSVRLDGMGVFNALLDMQPLPHLKQKVPYVPHRYCAICGEQLKLYSSSGHHCVDDEAEVFYRVETRAVNENFKEVEVFRMLGDENAKKYFREKYGQDKVNDVHLVRIDSAERNTFVDYKSRMD